MIMSIDAKAIVQKALEAANQAGDEWMKLANPNNENVDRVMLDVCGFANVQFTDKRCKEFKAFKKAGLIRSEYSNTIDIYHKWKHRQDWALAETCAHAAYKVLREAGIDKIKVWSRID
jgi:hypothetical protein